MDSKVKNVLTENTVLLVQQLKFEHLADHLVNHEVLPVQLVSSIITKWHSNTERIQMLIVELKKSANPLSYYRFLLALNSAGHSDVAQTLEPNFHDGQSFSNGNENNNSQTGQSYFSQQLGHLIQPAVYHHVPPQQINSMQLPHGATAPGILHAQSEPMSQQSESLNGQMDVDMPDDQQDGTTAEYSVVQEVQIQIAPDFVISEENYNMTTKPKGNCLIINNVDFRDGPTRAELMETRHGSDHDATLLSKLFEQLGYKIHMYKNLPARGSVSMREVIKSFSARSDHASVDSAVIIILSHGKSGDQIYGTDAETIPMERILRYFNNENCRGLLGKPKMFFVQACRGSELDRGVVSDCVHDSPAGPGTVHNVALSRRDSMEDRIPRTSTWSDMMVTYSTCPGYVSIRNTTLGSWFVQAIVKIFMSRAHNTHIQDMMNLVSYEIKNRFQTSCGEKQAIEVVYRSWVKKLNFNPGRNL